MRPRLAREHFGVCSRTGTARDGAGVALRPTDPAEGDHGTLRRKIDRRCDRSPPRRVDAPKIDALKEKNFAFLDDFPTSIHRHPIPPLRNHGPKPVAQAVMLSDGNVSGLDVEAMKDRAKRFLHVALYF